VSVTEKVEQRLHRRVGEGMRQPHNWIQLIKFGAVGASGYVVNLIVYEIARQQFDVHYLVAAVIAFIFAVTNNFLWNRHWTFKATDGHAGFQAARFFVVSLFALAFNLLLLQILVGAGVGEFPAQAVAVICATPLNFVGNKLWSFREDKVADEVLDEL
jgi:dolichol-phosphate mannosyltransferase